MNVTPLLFVTGLYNRWACVSRLMSR